MKIRFLPEDYVKHLEDYNYEETAGRYRADMEKKGETVTKAQEQEYITRIRSMMERKISEFKKLHQRTLKPKIGEAEPSWEDLLASFYRVQREQRLK
jgi:hypothetical protein